MALVLLALPCLADTTLIAPSTYEVDQGVAFSISNSGASSFLFSWSDGSGSFTDIADPTLILVEDQTYTFARTSSSHPFLITLDSLPVSGSAGSYVRTTTDLAEIEGNAMSPQDEFTADPAPTSDLITWTPGNFDIGNYYYTCLITFHTGMTGALEVVAKAVPTQDQSWSGVKAIFRP